MINFNRFKLNSEDNTSNAKNNLFLKYDLKLHYNELDKKRNYSLTSYIYHDWALYDGHYTVICKIFLDS